MCAMRFDKRCTAGISYCIPAKHLHPADSQFAGCRCPPGVGAMQRIAPETSGVFGARLRHADSPL